MSVAALQSLLGLTDEELLAILDSDPLAVITGDEDYRPEVRVLLGLLQELDPAVLRRWVRTGPLQLLLQQDFAGFEDALGEFRERGLVITKRGTSPPPHPDRPTA